MIIQVPNPMELQLKGNINKEMTFPNTAIIKYKKAGVLRLYKSISRIEDINDKV